MTHTLTPWTSHKSHDGVDRAHILAEEDRGLNQVASVYREEDAAHIVRCVNNHEALVELAEATLSYCEDDSRSPRRRTEMITAARAALEAVK